HAELMMMDHPWLRVYKSAFTDRFSRTQGIIVQCNSLLLSLFLTFMIYYSRASQCCSQFKEYLGCESAVARGSESLCMNACRVLHDPPEGFKCTAFPQDDRLKDTVWTAVIVVGIMLPVNQGLRLLFTRGGAPSGPRHVFKRLGGVSRFSVRQAIGSWVEVGMLLQGVFFVPSRTSSSIAPLFWLFTMTSNFTLTRVQRLCVWAVRRWQQLRSLQWLVWQLYGRGENLQEVLQQIELSAREREKKEADLQQQFGEFVVACQEPNCLATQLSYVGIICSWASVVWLQVTYATEVRDLLGPSVQVKVIHGWLLSMFVDSLIVQFIIKMILHALVRFLFQQYNNHQMDDESVQTWYEDYVAKYLHTSYSLQSSADAEANSVIKKYPQAPNQCQQPAHPEKRAKFVYKTLSITG
ncbi:hypothetical protein CYMTET_45020, partial [Cymbomonas tetramitiformis]